jgi:ribosomal protein L12E/L44/L45/RPP1/RPP2
MGFGVSPLGEMGTGISSITSRPNIIEDMGQQNIKNMIEAAKQKKAEAAAAKQRKAEAAAAAAGGDRQRQAMQRAADQARIDAANRQYRDDRASYSGSYDAKDDTSYSDPFDPGGGE